MKKNKFLVVESFFIITALISYLFIYLYRTDADMKDILLGNLPIYLLFVVLITVPISLYLTKKPKLTKTESSETRDNLMKLVENLSSENLYLIEYDEDDELSKMVNKMNEIVDDYYKLLYYTQNSDKSPEVYSLLNDIHEQLSVPLGVIKSYAEQIKEGIWEQDDAYLDIIFNEVSRMERFLHQINIVKEYDYDFEVSESGVDLKTVFDEVINDQAPFIEMKELTIHYDGELPVIRSDQKSIEVAIENLVNNAVKYAYWETEVLISSSENTVGISNVCDPLPEEELNKIWDKYYSTSKDSGLGLHIVKEIFDTLEIEYGVDNYESGVTFWFKV